MSNDMIRMSGMNSGLDTEAIIKALTANKKLKITKQERNVLKYQATQEAYRDVISKLSNLKKSYFDVLKKDSYLSGSTMWNKYAAKTLVDGAEKTMAGVSIATTINSKAGDYKIKVNKTATQAKLSGSSLSDGAKVDVASMEEGKDYGISVTVGDETKNISFTAGATKEETLNNLNEQLSDAFGKSNASAAGSKEGMVYVDGTGKFVSRSGKGISISGVGNMTGNKSLDMSSVATGKNTLSFQVGDEVLNVSFQTLSKDYFDDIFDDEGNLKSEDDLSSEGKEKLALYNQVKDDYVESKKYDAYKSWSETATDADKEALKQAAFDKASEAQHDKYLDRYLNKEYDKYKKELGEGEEAQSFDDWKAANYADEEGNALSDGFKDYYYTHELPMSDDDKAEKAAELSSYIDEKFEAYNAEHPDELSKEDFAEKVKNGEEGFEDISEGYSAIEGKWDRKFTYEGYELDKDIWEQVSYHEYSAYKDEVCDVKEEDLSFTNNDIINHYNETSLNNSIGSLETKSGIKFSVELNGDVADIKATDKDGNEKGFSVTSAAGSTNGFGASAATTSVSQITNKTKLSDLGIDADENGKYSFSINGEKFSFNADTTVNDMMKQVNANAKAGVKMSYSSLDNAFTVTANEYGTASKIELGDDSQGLLTGLGLMSGSSYSAGSNLEVEINGKVYESTGNSIEADGTTFTFTSASEGAEFTASIAKDVSATADVIKKFVEDYNKVIEDVYKYLDEKPEKSYYFLADQDKEDLDLSEKEEEKWEEKAKLGLLYHDSTTSTAMTNLRMALMGSVEGSDGKAFGLASLGITTSTDYKEHGKLIIDEDKLMAAIEEHSDDIAKLFSDDENGIMKKFAKALDGAVGTTGDKGTLVNKAGLATGSTATDNQLYETIKRTKQKIATLTTRYEAEEDRLWKKYSAMEKMLGNMNQQQSSMMSYFGQ